MLMCSAPNHVRGSLQAASSGAQQRADEAHGGRVVPLLRGAVQLQEVLSAAGAISINPNSVHNFVCTPLLAAALPLS